MVLQSILLLLTGAVLAYASHYDIKNREIQLYTILLIGFLGFLFFVASSGSIFSLIYAEIAITMIFFIPAVIGMGWGDMLLFWSMGFFFAEGLNVFLICFFIAAVFLTYYYVKKEGVLKNKEKMKNFYFPLIPAIFTGFICLVVFRIYLFF